MTTADRVRDEMRRFERALPELLPSLRGKWVVFKDGIVASAHDSEEGAYLAGLASFGRRGGHVVAQVIETQSVPLSAAFVYQKRV